MLTIDPLRCFNMTRPASRQQIKVPFALTDMTSSHSEALWSMVRLTFSMIPAQFTK
jgi:hypothetical protein